MRPAGWVGFCSACSSPIFSLSKDRPLLGWGCLACLLPPSPGLAAFSRSGP